MENVLINNTNRGASRVNRKETIMAKLFATIVAALAVMITTNTAWATPCADCRKLPTIADRKTCFGDCDESAPALVTPTPAAPQAAPATKESAAPAAPTAVATSGGKKGGKHGKSLCGNGVCDEGESNAICAKDCPCAAAGCPEGWACFASACEPICTADVLKQIPQCPVPPACPGVDLTWVYVLLAICIGLLGWVLYLLLRKEEWSECPECHVKLVLRGKCRSCGYEVPPPAPPATPPSATVGAALVVLLAVICITKTAFAEDNYSFMFDERIVQLGNNYHFFEGGEWAKSLADDTEFKAGSEALATVPKNLNKYFVPLAPKELAKLEAEWEKHLAKFGCHKAPFVNAKGRTIEGLYQWNGCEGIYQKSLNTAKQLIAETSDPELRQLAEGFVKVSEFHMGIKDEQGIVKTPAQMQKVIAELQTAAYLTPSENWAHLFGYRTASKAPVTEFVPSVEEKVLFEVGGDGSIVSRTMVFLDYCPKELAPFCFGPGGGINVIVKEGDGTKYDQKNEGRIGPVGAVRVTAKGDLGEGFAIYGEAYGTATEGGLGGGAGAGIQYQPAKEFSAKVGGSCEYMNTGKSLSESSFNGSHAPAVGGFYCGPGAEARLHFEF